MIEMPEQTDAFLPVRFSEEDERGRFSPGHIAIARLKPRVTPEQARAELDSTMSTFPSLNLKEMNTRVGVQPLHEAIVANVRTSLLMLLCSVGFVLLIGCANVANLSLVRATQRSRELAIRIALGASKWQLMNFLLTESLLLALGGTVVGSLLSMWIIDVVISWASGQLPRLEETSVDVNVFAFAVGICAFTTILFGLFPAWRASGADPQQALKAAGRSSTDTLQTGRVRAVLVCAEVALGTVLIIGCGLLLASLHNVMNAPPGFEGNDILIADLVLPSPRYQEVDKQVSFFRATRDAISSIPGVNNVAANTRVPLRFDDLDAVTREGEENICSPSVGCRMDASNLLPPLASWSNVSSDYFDAVRIPLRAGRLFRDRESERVAVISESTARILWPGDNPLGKRLIRPFENLGVYWRVVGIVGDVRSGGLDRAPAITIYRPYEQRGGLVFSLVIRTVIAPQALAKAVRGSVARVDAGIPAPEIRTMPDIIARSVHQRRFQASVLAAFALVAVLLAAIGIYGVVAYSVLQRRKEIGVRIALGADSWDIRRIILKNGMTPVLCGLMVGLMVSALFARLIASLLFEVNTYDVGTFTVAPLILLLTAAIPCWLHARRASRTDATVVLRFD